MRLSIRFKILIALCVLLVAAVCFYTGLAYTIFREEKTALLYDINHSLAVNTAAQLRASLQQATERLRFFSFSQVLIDRSDVRLPSGFLKSGGIVAAQLFISQGKGLAPVRSRDETPALALSDEQLAVQLSSLSSAPQIFWSDFQEKIGSRYYLAARVDISVGGEARQYVAVGQLENESLFRSIQAANLYDLFLMTRNGEVVARLHRSELLPPGSIKGHPLVSKIADQKETVSSGVLSFHYESQDWYGAYAPLEMGGLYFVSQANQSEVKKALRTLIERSLLYGIIVITVTFIFTVLFSQTLTKNLKALAEGAKRIGRGNWDSKIQIRSRDEVQDLAKSFNEMIDELRASRDAIEKYNRELEQKVDERTKQLRETNAAIKEVQEKLIHATQLAAVGEVAGRTAHELLNPLTAILSRIERSLGLMRTATSSVQMREIVGAWETDYKSGGFNQLVANLNTPSTVKQDYTLFEEDVENLKTLGEYWQKQTETVGADLSFVQQQAQRIHRIVDGMRELVRASVKEETSPVEAVLAACETMKDLFEKHNIQLSVDLPESHETAILNRDELVQIVSNLLRNAYQAVEANPGGMREVRVKGLKQNHYLLIDILDTGVGISSENQPRLFDQGFTTKAPTEGTGLGLAICRRYAHSFGGEVELLFSEPGSRGTAFRLTIPFKEKARIAV